MLATKSSCYWSNSHWRIRIFLFFAHQILSRCSLQKFQVLPLFKQNSTPVLHNRCILKLGKYLDRLWDWAKIQSITDFPSSLSRWWIIQMRWFIQVWWFWNVHCPFPLSSVAFALWTGKDLENRKDVANYSVTELLFLRPYAENFISV